VIISFEGGEGAGKTTCVERLCSHLNGKGLPWLSLREPGGSLLSEEIRALFLHRDMDVMTELLLVLASRARNIGSIIKPGLTEGKIVVMDRFVDSTLVYQGLMGGLGVDRVREIMEVTGTWLEPVLTFVLDVPAEVSLARIRPGDRFENRDMTYHRNLRNAFLSVCTQKRHRIIDAARPADAVLDEIICAVDSLLGGHPLWEHHKIN
jgi:dTMP kinase